MSGPSSSPGSAGFSLGIRRREQLAEQLYRRAPRTEGERRNRTAQVSRLLQLLRAHGLITKVRDSYRYRITAKGEKAMNASLYMRHRALPALLKLLDAAA